MATDLKTLNEYQRFAIQLAEDAGQMMLATSGKNTSIEKKQNNFVDLVTETDKSIEQYVFSRLKTQYPNHRFIGEETTTGIIDFTDEPTWIIDPIDGTMNYTHQLAFACISIGLTIGKKPVLGVIYSPFLRRLYTAISGGGAYLNGAPISVKKNCKRLEEALIIYEQGADRSEQRIQQWLENMMSIAWRVHGTRAFGSAALNLCSIADGQVDSYYEFGLHCWDMCAGIAIVREAGGIVIDPRGCELDLMSRRMLAAATPELAKEVISTIKIQQEPGRD